MDEALTALARRAQSDPEDLEAWTRLLDAARGRGWSHEGCSLADCWGALCETEDRAALVGELRAADPLDLALYFERLKKGDWRERPIAAEALGLRGARTAIPALCAALQDGFKETRVAALEALRLLDPEGGVAARALCRGLNVRDLGVKNWSAEALGALGQGARGLDDVARGLEAPSVLERGDALRRLGSLGIAAALPLVRSRLKDEDSSVRVAAIAALGALAHHQPAVLDELLPLLEHRDASIHEAAIGALARNEAGERAAPALIAIARGATPHRALWALCWLARLAPLEPELPALLGPFYERDLVGSDELRFFAALGALAQREGFPGEHLAPMAARALESLGNAALSEAALSILNALPAGAEAALFDYRREGGGRQETRRIVARGLVAIGVASPATRALLDELLADEDFVVQREAIAAAAACQDPELVFSRLLPCLDGPHPRAAARGLERWAFRLDFSEAIVAALRGLLNGPRAELRAIAARAFLEERGGAALRDPELLVLVRANLEDIDAEMALDRAFDEEEEAADRARALAFVRAEDLERERLEALIDHPDADLSGVARERLAEGR